MMKIRIVYFAYLAPGAWRPVVLEQLNALKALALYGSSTIHMSVVSNDAELAGLREMLARDYPEITLANVFQENVFEYPGIKTVWEAAQESDPDTIILYFHSKGMTSGEHDARRKLFTWTIENHYYYAKAFENDPRLDIGCLMPHVEGFAYFNFFWVRAGYVKAHCPKPEISADRYVWETWLKPIDAHVPKVFSPMGLVMHGKFPLVNIRVLQILNGLK